MTHGYSGTPLVQKLGIKPGDHIAAINPPEHYLELLDPMPAGVRIDEDASAETRLVHLFVTEQSVLEAQLARMRTTLVPTAVLWVSWPKRTSKMPTDVSEDIIRELALPMGWVDVKVCAVDQVWSGLKLMVRTALR
ncbi:MAG TPA: DUF3052 domain-containing protein [Gemmatimonas sp.]|uniref:DUF3052 domain-containing protein n=1 Tax=Gemmatimonas sp. TaxID=1962908 RepID=UPI002EDAC917